MSSNEPVIAPCFICGENAQGRHGFDDDTDTVECDRCGRYRITGTAEEILAGGQYTPAQKAQLCAACRRATDNGTHVEITSALLPHLIDSVTPPRDPMEAGDDVLMYVRRRTLSFGAPVAFNIATVYPVFALPNAGALSNVVLYMESQNWVTATRGPTGTLALQPSGYSRVRELEATTRASSRAFVAMSFDPKLRSAYDIGIHPAITSAGFEPIRVDDVPHNDRIDERIIVEIRRSAFIVADVSDPRTGVFFEAGYGLGLGLPVIWTCSAEAFGELPTHFDTRQFNHIKWETPDDLRLQLKTRILATVPNAVAAN